MSENRAQVFGVEVPDLPEGWQPVEVVVIAKCLLPEGDESGAYSVAIRPSEGLYPWDTAGLLKTATVMNETDLRDGATPGGEDL